MLKMLKNLLVDDFLYGVITQSLVHILWIENTIPVVPCIPLVAVLKISDSSQLVEKTNNKHLLLNIRRR
jgi:hypothetical protein